MFLREYGFHPNTGFVHFASLFALLFLIEKSECADFSFDLPALQEKFPANQKT